MSGHNRPTELRVVHGHLSADSHGHIHQHKGELWSISVDVDVSSGDVLDVAIENPTDSGNILEILAWGVGIDGESKTTQWRDSGIYSGTATSVTPNNYTGTITAGSQDFDAEYSNGTGTQLVDTGTDTQFNGGFHSTSNRGSRKTATQGERPGIDVTVAEGEAWALHIEADDAINPIVGVTVAEYEKGRSI